MSCSPPRSAPTRSTPAIAFPSEYPPQHARTSRGSLRRAATRGAVLRVSLRHRSHARGNRSGARAALAQGKHRRNLRGRASTLARALLTRPREAERSLSRAPAARRRRGIFPRASTRSWCASGCAPPRRRARPLLREQPRRILERLELERVAGRIVEKHRRLLAHLAREADSGFDFEARIRVFAGARRAPARRPTPSPRRNAARARRARRPRCGARASSCRDRGAPPAGGRRNRSPPTHRCCGLPGSRTTRRKNRAPRDRS